MSESNIPYRSIAELGRAFRTGETGPVAVTTLLLDRIDMAKPFQEHMALRVAQAYERETDWHTRRLELDWAG